MRILVAAMVAAMPVYAQHSRMSPEEPEGAGLDDEVEGVSPRDFVLGTMSMMTAGMWAAMAKSYPDAKMPPEISPKNVKFLQDHPEVMQQWEAAWSEGHGRHGRPPPPQQGGQEQKEH